MKVEAVTGQFKEKVCAEIRLMEEGENRFRVFTPFSFDDGDQLSIVLKKNGAGWKLTDEAHTYMHLSYRFDDRFLTEGNRGKVIRNALNAFGVEEKNNEFYVPIRDNDYGDALFSFVQALIKITDVSYLSREIVRSTFIEDCKKLISEKVPANRLHFDWYDKEHDPKAKYPVDCKLNGLATPLFMYFINGDDKARDSTIYLLQFEKWKLSYNSLVIFEDQEAVNKKVLARLSDVCGKQFSNLQSENQNRIESYLEKYAAGSITH